MEGRKRDVACGEYLLYTWHYAVHQGTMHLVVDTLNILLRCYFANKKDSMHCSLFPLSCSHNPMEVVKPNFCYGMVVMPGFYFFILFIFERGCLLFLVFFCKISLPTTTLPTLLLYTFYPFPPDMALHKKTKTLPTPVP